jgi:hypothetical protein
LFEECQSKADSREPTANCRATLQEAIVEVNRNLRSIPDISPMNPEKTGRKQGRSRD